MPTPAEEHPATDLSGFAAPFRWLHIYVYLRTLSWRKRSRQLMQLMQFLCRRAKKSQPRTGQSLVCSLTFCCLFCVACASVIVFICLCFWVDYLMFELWFEQPFFSYEVAARKRRCCFFFICTLYVCPLPAIVAEKYKASPARSLCLSLSSLSLALPLLAACVCACVLRLIASAVCRAVEAVVVSSRAMCIAFYSTHNQTSSVSRPVIREATPPTTMYCGLQQNIVWFGFCAFSFNLILLLFIKFTLDYRHW